MMVRNEIYHYREGTDTERKAKITLPLKGDFRIYEVSKNDGKQRVLFNSAAELSITLEPGDAVLYRFQKADEEAFTCEYELSE